MATILVHFVVNATSPYELHRDALLYLAMGRHLRLFAMDFPPFIAILAEATRALLGDSLVAIRTGPALAHGGLVLLAGLFARRAGGGRAAEALAALVVATAPLYLRAGVLFQPVIFDQLWWTLAWYALARLALLRAGAPVAASAQAGGRPDAATPLDALRSDPRFWWAVLGLAAGLGLLTKLTALLFGFATLLAIVATPLRQSLRSPWPWLAGVLALALGSPSLIGQAALDWPFFSQFQDLQSVQLERVTPLAFVATQPLEVGPAVLVGVAGAVAPFVVPAFRSFRPVALAAALSFVLLLVTGGKSYYAGPVWPALIGIGFAASAAWARSLAGRWPAAPAAVPGTLGALVVAYGLLALPLGLPFLPPEPMAAYANRLGVEEAVTTNRGERLPLPQDYADMIGWSELADSVAAVYRALPPEDRGRAVILATNYGRAGAIDFYGRRRGLPAAVAPVGSYWFFGPGPLPGEVTIVVGEEPEGLAPYFGRADLARRVQRPWGVTEEWDVPIVVARDPLRSLQEIWPEFEGMN